MPRSPGPIVKGLKSVSIALMYTLCQLNTSLFLIHLSSHHQSRTITAPALSVAACQIKGVLSRIGVYQYISDVRVMADIEGGRIYWFQVSPMDDCQHRDALGRVHPQRKLRRYMKYPYPAKYKLFAVAVN